MKKITRTFIILSAFVLHLAIMCDNSSAKLAVELLADPDIRTLPLEAGSKKITITARTNQAQVQFRWSLTGPGKLEGVVTASGMTYIPPNRIDGPDTQAIVAVTITNDQGETASESLAFTFGQLFVDCSAAKTKTFEEVQKILPEHLQKYTTFKNEESLGFQRNKEIMGVLTEIICDLKAIESLLDQKYSAKPPEIVEKIQKTQNTRSQYEKEWLDRRER